MKEQKYAVKTKPKKSTLAKTNQKLSMQEILHQDIAKRAYEIYEQRIQKSALDDWLQAEREILQDQDRPHRGGYAGVEKE